MFFGVFQFVLCKVQCNEFHRKCWFEVLEVKVADTCDLSFEPNLFCSHFTCVGLSELCQARPIEPLWSVQDIFTESKKDSKRCFQNRMLLF